MKRSRLRFRRKAPTPIMKLYVQEVRRRRKLEGKPANLYAPHHVDPPHGKRPLFFVLITHEQHREIHARANAARQEGWLTNINGSLTVMQPQVVAALEREKRLLEELEN